MTTVVTFITLTDNQSAGFCEIPYRLSLSKTAYKNGNLFIFGGIGSVGKNYKIDC